MTLQVSDLPVQNYHPTSNPEASEAPGAFGGVTVTGQFAQGAYLQQGESSARTDIHNRKLTLPSATEFPVKIDLHQSSEIVQKRLEKIFSAMQCSNLQGSEGIFNEIQSALKSAPSDGNICKLNAIWRKYHGRVVYSNNPSFKALTQGFEQCNNKKAVLEKLAENINKIDLSSDKDLQDLFLVDLISHFMSIGALIELCNEKEVIDNNITENLMKALEVHDKTKLFDEITTHVDGKPVITDSLNEDRMKGYMLLPLIFTVVQNHPQIKEHKIQIAAEVKEGCPLNRTCIATPIAEHTTSEMHHCEYWIKNGKPMPLIFIWEFFFDGLGASVRLDRVKDDDTFADTLTKSLKFWMTRLELEGDTEDDHKKAFWSKLANTNELKALINENIPKLIELIGSRRPAELFGSLARAKTAD